MAKITVLITLFLLATTTMLQAQAPIAKKKILLIGSFHFENPGLDVAKVNTFNVMTEKSQKELEQITNKIQKFGPDKIFVEWSATKQNKLDNLYNLNSDSLLRSRADEIVQIALRSAKKLHHTKLYGIDNRNSEFPYDSLVKGMKDAGQDALLEANEQNMKNYEIESNRKRKTYTLTKLLLDLNGKDYVNMDLQWYLNIANRAGKPDNGVGAYLVSEWYKRNLYMYALVQKLTESKDTSVMVLLGASHAAMFREFIRHDPEFELVELKSIL